MTNGLGIDFNFYKMERKDFFSYYIPALEKALDYVNKLDFELCGPDSFIDDETIRNSVDKFEDENYYEFKKLFDTVTIYLDAKSHNFNEIEGISVEDYKKEIINEISKIKSIYFQP